MYILVALQIFQITFNSGKTGIQTDLCIVTMAPKVSINVSFVNISCPWP